MFLKILFVHAAARSGICVFTLNIVKTLIKDNLTQRQTFDLDIESTHGQPASCRARPMNVDDGLEDIRWGRRLGGEWSPTASYALLPNLKNRSIFWQRRGIEIFYRLFSTQQRPNVFVADAWPATATYHRQFCDQRVGRSP